MIVIAVPNHPYPPSPAALAGAIRVLASLSALDLATLDLPPAAAGVDRP